MIYLLWAAFVGLIVVYVVIKKSQKKSAGVPIQGPSGSQM